MSGELLSVEQVAERLQIHPKTVLKFIREQKLRASKVGKQYRVLRSDIDTFSGAPTAQPPRSRATAIIDIEDVDGALLQRLTATLMGARTGTTSGDGALSLNIAHDPLRRSIKVVAIGDPGDVAATLQLIDACLEG
jgi:excisionase family DNA binding protein